MAPGCYFKRFAKFHAIFYLLLNHKQLECGLMPNVMAALPNIGHALCSTPQGLADAHYWSAMQ